MLINIEIIFIEKKKKSGWLGVLAATLDPHPQHFSCLKNLDFNKK